MGRMTHPAPPALLAVSHGTASAAGQAAVQALVDAVAARLPDITVRLGHVDVQQPDVAASLASIPDDQPVVIVPLLLSAGYHVRVDLVEQTAHRPGVTITPALGPDERLAALLADELTTMDAAPDAPVVLAVAGSSDDRANDDCRAVGAMLAERLGRPVTVGFLAAADPRLGAAVADARDAASRIPVVANYLLAPGYFHDLAVKLAAGAPVAAPLLEPDRTPEALVDIVIDRFRAAVG